MLCFKFIFGFILFFSDQFNFCFPQHNNISANYQHFFLSSLQASRDYVVGQIMLACTEIIKIVESREDLDQSVDEPGYMAATLEKVVI